VNKEMHIHILRPLRDAVRRKRPEKYKTNSWFLLRNNAPAQRSVLVKDYLAKNKVTTLEHIPYSSDLAPDDCYLFPRLKSALKGWSFCDATDIIQNATEELKRLSQNGLQERFQNLCNRWQKCIHSCIRRRKEVELKLLLCFVFFRNKVIPGTF
jgi:hypothetical protein